MAIGSGKYDRSKMINDRLNKVIKDKQELEARYSNLTKDEKDTLRKLRVKHTNMKYHMKKKAQKLAASST